MVLVPGRSKWPSNRHTLNILIDCSHYVPLEAGTLVFCFARGVVTSKKERESRWNNLAIYIPSNMIKEIGLVLRLLCHAFADKRTACARRKNNLGLLSSALFFPEPTVIGLYVNSLSTTIARKLTSFAAFTNGRWNFIKKSISFICYYR